MATYTIEVPDGRKIKIVADDPDKALAGAEEWASSNPKGAGGSYSSGIADAAAQGVTFGFGDEIEAGFDALTGYKRSPGSEGEFFKRLSDFGNYEGSFGDRYNEALEANRSTRDEFSEENLGSAIAAEIGGGLVTGAGLAKGGATLLGRTAGKTLFPRVAAGAGEGAAYGSAYGAGNADEESRLSGAMSGAVTGALLGGAIPAVGAGAKRIAAPVARMIGKALNPASAQNSAAAERVLAEAKKAGLSADDLAQGAREGRSVGQQDVLLSDMTRAVKRQPGEARKIIDDSLNAGYEANNQAAKEAVSEGLEAPGNFYKWRDSFAKSKSKNAKTAYKMAFDQNWGTKGPPFALDDIFKSGRIPASALRSAQKIAQAEGRPLGKNLVASIDDATGEVTFSRLPSLEEAELIRRGLKSEVTKAFRAGDGGVGVAYKDLEQQMRGILDEASPTLKKVRQSYATSSQIQEAADEGLKLLNKSADEVEYLISGKSPNELAAMRMGVANDLKHRIERGMLNRDAVRQIFGSERNRRVLEKLWPSKEAFTSFRRQMENSSEFSSFRQNVQGNSRTQQDLADSGALGGGWGGAVRNLATGNVRGAAIDALIEIGSRATNPAKGLPPQQLRRMAEILVSKNPNEVQKLLAQAQAGDDSAHRALEMKIRQLMDNPQAQRALTVGGVVATQ